MSEEKIEISIVSPVYRAEGLVKTLVDRLQIVLSSLEVTYEIILVDDASPDNSWAVMCAEAENNSQLKIFQLSRNFGQHNAITAGLSQAKGKWIVVMDCDLQDRPEEITALYREAQKGYDQVVARRVVRQDSWLKIMSSKAFYSLFSYLTDTTQDPSVANFGIYHRTVIDAILSMGDKIRYFPTMSQWVGFKRGHLDVKHEARPTGESSYNFRSLFALAFDNILAFSDKPLKLTVKLGFWIAFTSMIMGGYYLYQYGVGNIEVLGFASLIVSISFFSGMVIMILGIIGLYLGKTFEQVKARPQFIIREGGKFN